MKTLPNHDVLTAIAHRIDPGARLLRAWPLTGGVSAHMTGLALDLPGAGPRTLILRRHSAQTYAGYPQVTANEARVLRTLHAAGLPVPEPVLLDTACDIMPTPYLVLSYIDGAALFDLAAKPDLVTELAATLARIHSLDPIEHDLAFLPVQDSGIRPRPDVLDDSLDEGRIREAMARAWRKLGAAPALPGNVPALPDNVPALLHGDFWPGNALWHEGCLVGIIDWEDARMGDPLVDLAKCRLEILWAFGPRGMRQFTATYLALMPHIDTAHLPYWELAAALEPCGNLGDWGLPPAKERRFRRLHHAFVTQALARLG